jgi:hypothetical protein
VVSTRKSQTRTGQTDTGPLNSELKETKLTGAISEYVSMVKRKSVLGLSRESHDEGMVEGVYRFKKRVPTSGSETMQEQGKEAYFFTHIYTPMTAGLMYTACDYRVESELQDEATTGGCARIERTQCLCRSLYKASSTQMPSLRPETSVLRTLEAGG